MKPRAIRYLSIAIGTAFFALSVSALPTQIPAEYLQHCALCHGHQAQGSQFGPPLSGTEFSARWQNRNDELLAVISEQMPPEAPGSLSADTYKKTAEYVLAVAGLRSEKEKVLSRGQLAGKEFALPDMPPQNFDQIYSEAMKIRQSLASAMEPVDDATLDNPSADDWPAFRRSYSQTSFSPLDEINTENVRGLRLAWSWSLKPSGAVIEPLVYQGLLFIHSAGRVQALDATRGDLVWQYEVKDKGKSRFSGNPRSIALYGKSLYVPTLDGRMIALDATSGEELWVHEFQLGGKIQLSAGPIVVRDKVIQGISGCGMAPIVGGCAIIALDAKTGEERWRFHTLAKPGEPGGDSWNGAPLEERFGGSVWTTGSYDSESNLVYFGPGQTYWTTPLLVPLRDQGPGNAALYTSATLALNPDNGELVWHYQHFERDVWDMDWAFERSLVDIPMKDGKTEQAVVTIGKLGILDVLNAETGQYLYSHDFGLQDIVGKIEPATGRKIARPEKIPRANERQSVCPSAAGARNWPTTAYHPGSHTLYIPMLELCMDYIWNPESHDRGYHHKIRPDSDGRFGRLVAFDLVDRKVRWTSRQRAPNTSALLATAGGIVFTGAQDRMFRAVDGETGKTLWNARLDGPPTSFPISFRANGKQYVAVIAGAGGVSFTYSRFTPELDGVHRGKTLWVFALPDAGESEK